MKNLLKTAAILAFFLPCTAVWAEGSTLRTITVTGEDSQQVTPDQAILSLSLASRDADLNKAKQQADALVSKLVIITNDFHIAKEKIAMSNLNISPEYSYPDGKQKLEGYVVSRSFRVTLDDISMYERLISVIVDAKITEVNNIEFRLANSEKFAAKVRANAFENARAKAYALAGAAGAKLGSAITIMTESNSLPVGGPRPVMALARTAAESPAAPALPGMVVLSENVTVTFGME